MANFVKVYEFIKPDVDKIEDLIEDVFKDCNYKGFNSFNRWSYIYNFKSVNGKDVENRDFIVSFDSGSIRYRSVRFIRHALRDINIFTIKIFAKVSDLNICYYLKKSLPSSLERIFYKNISNICEYINT